MADEIAQARAQVAATRDRIDRGLTELTAQVPDRDEVVATAARIGAALGATVVAVGGLVLYGKRRSAGKERRADARAYAQALVDALPEVAEAVVAARAPERLAAAERATPAPKPTTAGDDDAGRGRGTMVTAALLAIGTATGLVIARRSA